MHNKESTKADNEESTAVAKDFGTNAIFFGVQTHLFLDIPRHPKPFCDSIMVRLTTNGDCKHTKKHYLSAINFINCMSIYNCMPHTMQ